MHREWKLETENWKLTYKCSNAKDIYKSSFQELPRKTDISSNSWCFLGFLRLWKPWKLFGHLPDVNAFSTLFFSYFLASVLIDKIMSTAPYCCILINTFYGCQPYWHCHTDPWSITRVKPLNNGLESDSDTVWPGSWQHLWSWWTTVFDKVG